MNTVAKYFTLDQTKHEQVSAFMHARKKRKKKSKLLGTANCCFSKKQKKKKKKMGRRIFLKFKISLEESQTNKTNGDNHQAQSKAISTNQIAVFFYHHYLWKVTINILHGDNHQGKVASEATTFGLVRQVVTLLQSDCSTL